MTLIGNCPSCAGSGTAVVWGKAGSRTLQAAALGTVRAGGCIVRGSPDSTCFCAACQTSFSGPPTREAIAAALRRIDGGDGAAK